MVDNNNNNIPDVVEDAVKERRRNKLERFSFMEKYLQEIGTHTSVVLELIVALLVFVACVVGIISLFPALYHYVFSGEWSQLNHYLEQILTIVVGIEFLKMLCKPSSANVLETIIFVIARHMILADLNPLDDLLYVIAIVILVITKRFISMSHKQKEKI